METLEKHLFKIPLILYVFGFIVHNVYLSEFGSNEFQLVQAKYILSGFGLVGFIAICLAFTAIKINISDVGASFKQDKFFSWALRVISFPYIVYVTLYSDSLFKLSNPFESINLIKYSSFFIASTVVTYSIFNILLKIGECDTKLGKFFMLLSKILLVPMFIVTIIISWNVPEFSGVVKSTTFFFLGFVSLALNQSDEKYGIEYNYLDKEAKKEHENYFQILFGIIAIFFMFWIVITNYTKFIYPMIPVALGGARVEIVKICIKDNCIDSTLIQESNDWLTYINNNTNTVEKIKVSLVDKIIYKKDIKSKPFPSEDKKTIVVK